MSISPLSFTQVSGLSGQQNPYRQVRQDFRQLASALQNGDLSDAQSAYAKIQEILGASAGSSDSSGSNTLQNDFATLGQALESGNLSQAQSAFSQLQNDAAGSLSPEATAADQYTPTQNPVLQAQADYGQLASFLQNGDLTDAQAAYTNLQQLVQGYSGPANSTTAIQNDFTTLGQDLQSNNLSGAQSAFSQLQGDIQATQTQAAQQQPTSQTNNAPQGLPAQAQRADDHRHHHHHGGDSSSLNSGSTASSAGSNQAAAAVNVYA